MIINACLVVWHINAVCSTAAILFENSAAVFAK